MLAQRPIPWLDLVDGIGTGNVLVWSTLSFDKMRSSNGDFSLSGLMLHGETDLIFLHLDKGLPSQLKPNECTVSFTTVAKKRRVHLTIIIFDCESRHVYKKVYCERDKRRDVWCFLEYHVELLTSNGIKIKNPRFGNDQSLSLREAHQHHKIVPKSKKILPVV